MKLKINVVILQKCTTFANYMEIKNDLLRFKIM